MSTPTAALLQIAETGGSVNHVLTVAGRAALLDAYKAGLVHITNAAGGEVNAEQAINLASFDEQLNKLRVHLTTLGSDARNGRAVTPTDSLSELLLLDGAFVSRALETVDRATIIDAADRGLVTINGVATGTHVAVEWVLDRASNAQRAHDFCITVTQAGHDYRGGA